MVVKLEEMYQKKKSAYPFLREPRSDLNALYVLLYVSPVRGKDVWLFCVGHKVGEDAGKP